MMNRYKVVVTKEYWVEAATENEAHEIFFDKSVFPVHREVGSRAHKVCQSTKFILMGEVVNL